MSLPKTLSWVMRLSEVWRRYCHAARSALRRGVRRMRDEGLSAGRFSYALNKTLSLAVCLWVREPRAFVDDRARAIASLLSGDSM